MSWITPKTDWTTDDGIMATDLNRIEGNALAIRDGLLKKKLSYYANNTTAGGGAYNIRVVGGNLFSQSAVLGVMPGTFDIQKALGATEWAAGNATGSPCRVPGSNAVGANQWWYVFVLYNPTTAAFDVCMDDDFAGANIAGSAIETAGYTMWKRVACQFELGDPLSGSARLWDTVGKNNNFSISETRRESGIYDYQLLASLRLLTLIGNDLSGTPSIVPAGMSFPVKLVFDPKATGSGYITVASGYNISGGGDFLGIFVATGDNDNARTTTVTPNDSDQILVNCNLTIYWDIFVVGWIDNGED